VLVDVDVDVDVDVRSSDCACGLPAIVLEQPLTKPTPNMTAIRPLIVYPSR